MTHTLLIVENNPTLSQEVASFFAQAGWHTLVAHNIATAKQILAKKEHELSVVLADTHMPDGHVLQLFAECRTEDHVIEWIFWADQAVDTDIARATQLCAHDILAKSISMPRLQMICASAARASDAQRRIRDQGIQDSTRYQVARYPGRSKFSQALRNQLASLTKTPFTAVLIRGESGAETGFIAKILHSSSSRKRGPFLEVNCASLVPSSAEADLFGCTPTHQNIDTHPPKRSFLEQAQGGTLLLTDFDMLPQLLQAKLLRTIEEYALRPQSDSDLTKRAAQIICSAHRDIEALALNGSVNRSLLQRLSVFRIDLLPLRSRKEDLMDWVPTLLNEFNAATGKRIRFIPEQTWKVLRDYHWPFNVTELRNIMERSVMLATSDTLEIAPLKAQELLDLDAARLAEEAQQPPKVRELPPLKPQFDERQVTLPIDGTMTLDDMDKYIIQTVFERHNHNVMATSRALRTTRETLRYRIQKYGLETRKRRRNKTAREHVEETTDLNQ